MIAPEPLPSGSCARHLRFGRSSTTVRNETQPSQRRERASPCSARRVPPTSRRLDITTGQEVQDEAHAHARLRGPRIGVVCHHRYHRRESVKGYSLWDQSFSELTAEGSPVRPFMVAANCFPYAGLLTVFGQGVRAARPGEASRRTGVLLVAYGLTHLIGGVAFPMARRPVLVGAEETSVDAECSVRCAVDLSCGRAGSTVPELDRIARAAKPLSVWMPRGSRNAGP
jgi:hypothetical protein